MIQWRTRDWMTPHPESVRSTTNVRTARLHMQSEGYRHLLVADDGVVKGILSDRDVHGVKDGLAVAEVMSEVVLTVPLHQPLQDTLELLIERQIDSVGVTDEQGAIVGIFTSVDAMRALQKALRTG